VIVIGLDPGLQATGWGIIEAEGNRLRHIANGTVRSRASDPLADRLVQLYDALEAVIAEHRPAAAAVEETFVNTNPQSTLKLGQARGVVMLVAAKAGLPVAEYAARFVKKSIVGVGAADKRQIQAMIARLLPGCGTLGPDAADALAVAITHAHMARTAGAHSAARVMA
jgi:crossover junction endodeoxyribonuclease RuvC